MNGPEVLLNVSFGLLALSVGGGIYRLYHGKTVADRIVALDLLMLIVVGVLALLLVRTGDGTLLDMAFVVALVAFLGTVGVARYLEKSGGAR